MSLLDCTLLTDGSSDVALVPILEWVMRQHAGEVAVQFEWADLRHLRSPPRVLVDRIAKAVELYPCHVLFVHRDAEGQDAECRYGEIHGAVQTAEVRGLRVPHVCVVPIRMQEAWLLLDPVAIRKAADNPNGRAPLNLPPLHRIEAHPDPKAMLYESLRNASELRGRRLKRFHPASRAHLVPSYMTDFSPLRTLSAFQRLEDDIRNVVATLSPRVHS